MNELSGRRIGLFSYGSGLAASMFSMKVCTVEDGASKMKLQKLLHGKVAVLFSRVCLVFIVFRAGQKRAFASILSRGFSSITPFDVMHRGEADIATSYLLDGSRV